MGLTFGQRLSYELFNLVDVRRATNQGVSRREMEPLMASLADKLVQRPRDLAQCPICSQPPNDIRTPLFNLAHRTSKNKGSHHWILVGCPHMTAINFSAILNDEELDAYETAWAIEARKLFDTHTETWTPEQKNIRAQALEL